MIIKIINPPNPFARKPGDNRASERMRIACIRLLERCATEIEIICTRNKKLSILWMPSGFILNCVSERKNLLFDFFFWFSKEYDLLGRASKINPS